MSDQNARDKAGGKAPVAPPVEGGGAATLKVEGGHQTKFGDHRIHLKFHADAYIEGDGIYQGYIKDISMEGANIFLDHNMRNVKTIKLRIHVPPLTRSGELHVIELTGKITYTAYDSKELLFRSGVTFQKFDVESDVAYLKSCIAQHDV